MQSGNLNQDPFGRNPVSGFGDYEQTLLDDIAGVNQTGFQTAEMREKKKEFAEYEYDYSRAGNPTRTNLEKNIKASKIWWRPYYIIDKKNKQTYKQIL